MHTSSERRRPATRACSAAQVGPSGYVSRSAHETQAPGASRPASDLFVIPGSGRGPNVGPASASRAAIPSLRTPAEEPDAPVEHLQRLGCGLPVAVGLAGPTLSVVCGYASRSRSCAMKAAGAKRGKRSGRGAGVRLGVSAAAADDKAPGQEQEEQCAENDAGPDPVAARRSPSRGRAHCCDPE